MAQTGNSAARMSRTCRSQPRNRRTVEAPQIKMLRQAELTAWSIAGWWTSFASSALKQRRPGSLKNGSMRRRFTFAAADLFSIVGATFQVASRVAGPDIRPQNHI